MVLQPESHLQIYPEKIFCSEKVISSPKSKAMLCDMCKMVGQLSDQQRFRKQQLFCFVLLNCGFLLFVDVLLDDSLNLF